MIHRITRKPKTHADCWKYVVFLCGNAAQEAKVAGLAPEFPRKCATLAEANRLKKQVEAAGCPVSVERYGSF